MKTPNITGLTHDEINTLAVQHSESLRRDAFARSALAGMLAAGPMAYLDDNITAMAVAWADDLITELDKP